MTSPGPHDSPSTLHEIGWREHVGLPDLGIDSVRAKIDTGARTSALHASDIKEFERDGVRWVAFIVPVAARRHGVRCEARLIDRRGIKNTSGSSELRYVIETTIVLGNRCWMIEVSLTDRAQMEFDLIVGRTAIRRHKIVVCPDRSYLAGPPTLTRPSQAAWVDVQSPMLRQPAASAPHRDKGGKK